MTESIAIIGWEEGIAGQLHAFLCEAGRQVACFVNHQASPPHPDRSTPRPAQRFDYPTCDSFKGLPLITSARWGDDLLRMGVTTVFAAVSANDLRRRMLDLVPAGISTPAFIHPSATILPEAQIAPGALIFARAIVGYRAEVHRGAWLNTAAQIDHHTVVRPFATLLPAVVAAGNVDIAEESTIGSGAILFPRVVVGRKAVVGAGAVVRHDVCEGTVVVGIPAQLHRHAATTTED